MTTPIEYFGYAEQCRQKPVLTDTTTLFRRLAGLEFEGKAREIGSQGILFTPDGECTTVGRSGYSSLLRHDGLANTTVAPIVAWTGVSDSCARGDQAFSTKKPDL